QPQPFVLAHGPIPTAVGIANLCRKAPHPHERLVGDADDVKMEVVTGVAQMVTEIAAPLALTIPIRRDRLIGIPEPLDQIEPLAGAEAVGLPRNVGYHGWRAVSDGTRLRRRRLLRRG